MDVPKPIQIGQCFSIRANGKKGTRSRFAVFQCYCGNAFVARVALSKKGKVKSCGCLPGCRRPGEPSKHPLYQTWNSMVRRCHDPNCKDYPSYGGRGISVCQRWRDSFDQFIEDVAERPSRKHSIDRFPDNNGNYEPGNIRWATCEQQSANKRNNRLVVIDGETKTARAWARLLGIPKTTFLRRLNRGEPLVSSSGGGP